MAKPTATRAQLIERRVRRAAAARGLDEAVTWSFISEDEAARVRRRRLAAAKPDQRRDEGDAPVAAAGPDRRGAPQHRPRRRRRCDCSRSAAAISPTPSTRRSALLLAGEKQPRDWQAGKAQGFDAFDAKAEALALLEAAGVPVANLQLFPDAGPTWHPGRSATLRLGPKTVLAAFGELHPRLARPLDAPAGAVAAEIYLDAIPAARDSGRARPAFAPPALQAVTRDFAFLVPADLAADALVRAIRGADKAAITVGAPVRPVRDQGRPVAGRRSHAPARRQELHR